MVVVLKIMKRVHKENLISKNIAKGLKIESPKSPHFYLKPKLHRRAITSSVNCHTSKISEHVDYMADTPLQQGGTWKNAKKLQKGVPEHFGLVRRDLVFFFHV